MNGATISTLKACRIADIDRQRFNEYVSSGDYPCPPETSGRRAREFDEADLIALWIFARKMDKQGWRPLRAGIFAAQVLTQLRETPEADHAYVVASLASEGLRTIGEKLPSEGKLFFGTDAHEVVRVPLAAIRRIVRRDMEAESREDIAE